MESGGGSKKEEVCPQLLDLIPRERDHHEWVVKRGDELRSKTTSDENKLELRLGLPGQELCLNNNDQSNSNVNGGRGDYDHQSQQQQQQRLINLRYYQWYNQQQQQFQSNNITKTSQQQTLPVIAKESLLSSSQPSSCCTKVALDLQNGAEKKVFSPPPDTAVPNTSQKRTAPGPVVGWPPIRSFRKNLASNSSSKSAVDSQNESPNKKIASETPVETTCKKGLFVKINMDGVPIGRKVDLKAYDSYEKLSSAVDELFRDLLAAQRDIRGGGKMKNEEEEKEGKAITGVLDGSGEYTLVYEDNEGDRMLVGDVPWHMFVSTVKRLRVLKSSEVSALTFGNNNKNDKC